MKRARDQGSWSYRHAQQPQPEDCHQNQRHEEHENLGYLPEHYVILASPNPVYSRIILPADRPRRRIEISRLHFEDRCEASPRREKTREEAQASLPNE
jgi:hypothetical protein